MTLLLPKFHLPTFATDLDGGHAETIMRHYDPEAEIRVLHLDRPRDSLEVLHGGRDIAPWLSRTVLESVMHRVVKIVDGGDRVTFHEERLQRDGTWIVAMNVAEIHRGLIGHQYAILGWDVPRSAPVAREPGDGEIWTRWVDGQLRGRQASPTIRVATTGYRRACSRGTAKPRQLGSSKPTPRSPPARTC